ncbi:TetR/AcrR family transcriptional regulator [Thomasclavelia saccharogumia]|uniref:TetR/AcrR family transcriptional regulator n=1 Tax=Thomasclavelia saccharogumia TaxID=341225 RepID=UPI00047EACDC|nr:TetR/AcrR family transcriptional regulator [Thomasclavelia saccharogumia]
MKQKSENRSVRRTKKLLINHLIGLLKQKPINQISVKELTDLCDLNRGTFYLYYKDIYDMIEKLEQKIIDDLNQTLSSITITKPLDILDPFFSYIYENRDLMMALFGNNGDISFLSKLKKLVKKYIYDNLREIHQAQNDELYNFYFQFISFGFIGICEMWFFHYKQKTPHEMAVLTEKMIVDGVNIFQNEM